MATISWQVVIGAVAALGLTCVAQTATAQSRHASAPGGPSSRIRTDSPILGTLIRDASEQSQTLRALIAAINATNGIVYLNVGRCGRLRACLLHRVTLAGPSRVLNVLVDLPRGDADLTASIGHELQHALEVLSDSTITTDVGIRAFFLIHGLKIRGVLETRAAIAAGDAVRDEMHRSMATAGAC